MSDEHNNVCLSEIPSDLLLHFYTIHVCVLVLVASRGMVCEIRVKSFWEFFFCIRVSERNERKSILHIMKCM